MKQLHKIALAILIILCTLFATDIAFGKIADSLLLNNMGSKFEYAMLSENNPDLVFFGSSRADSHYDTPFINDSLNISAFNLGQPGRGLTYDNAVIDIYLQAHNPKMIVLELMPDALSGELNNRIKPLYPYIEQYPIIYDIACKVDKTNIYLLKSHLLRYNSEILEMIKRRSNTYQYNSYGFNPLSISNSQKDLHETELPFDYAIDNIAKNCLIDIFDLCKKYNVELVVAYSPELYIRHHELPTALCDSLGIRIMDFRGLRSADQDNDIFYDLFHLNEYGAREYTRHFMNELSCETKQFQQ